MKCLFFITFAFLLSACSDYFADANVQKGIEYYFNAEYDKAEKELKIALSKDLLMYSRKETFTILGNVYNELEQYDSSVVFHQKALALDSGYVDAWVNLGVVYRLTTEYDLAEYCYLKAQSINPDDPELNASLGALYVFKDDLENALKFLKLSVELDPALAVAHSNYALALAMNGEFESAEDELEKAVSLGYKKGDIIKDRIQKLKDEQ